jgi:hypothetical protein
MRCCVVACQAAALVLATAGVGQAQPATEAEAGIKRGIELRRKGEDEAALREFEKAQALAPTPRGAAQTGLCEQQLERWLDAELHINEALRGVRDPWIRKNRKVIEESLATVRSKIGRVRVGGDPGGAEVMVNGQNVGRLPLSEPARALPGPVRVELRAPGYAPASVTVIATAGQETRVDLRLEKERATPAPAAALPAAPTVVVVREPAAVALAAGTGTPASADASPGTGIKVARWLTLVAAVALVGGGVYEALTHENKIADFNRLDCSLDTAGRAYQAGMPSATCQRTNTEAGDAKRFATYGFVGAGVMAATSAVLFLAF